MTFWLWDSRSSNLLCIQPLEACRAEQCTSDIIIEPPVRLDVLGERWYDGLTSGHKPFEDGRFEGLSIVPLCTRGPFT